MKSDFYTYEDNPIFHLAIPVDNILNAREFYTSVLGCDVGRESSKWVDLNFFGHQLVIHLVNDSLRGESEFNEVDGHKVPASHFGIILSWDNFSSLETHLLSNNIKLSLKLRLDGVYIPSFNNKINYTRSFSLPKSFKIIGSAHNLREIYLKQKQM